ncbi:circadian clock-controlled protein daywake [Leptinotarsa decemlineata]|uniref:circadian clock-controlled protein daywake n=1 Tax=Leptinotarsa decemlineata TaxID=7539 RepID=UPI003D308974
MNIVLCKVLILLFSLGYGYKFPEKFKRCHLNDPDLDSCLDTAIEVAIQLIGGSGIPSLHLLPIDPLRIETLEIGEGSSAVNLVQKYKDIKLHGFSKLKVEDSHYDASKKVLKFNSIHPEVIQEADYDFNGKILVIPVYGKGASNVTLENWRINHTITFEEVTKDNKKYFTVPSYTIKVNTSYAHFDFKNLFNGNEELSKTVHKVMNENWSVIIDDIKVGIELGYQEVFRQLTNKFLEAVPIDDVFLE